MIRNHKMFDYVFIIGVIALVFYGLAYGGAAVLLLMQRVGN